jgi:hypothetical protein
MSLSLSAYLNERFQFTYDVSGYAGLYTALGTATWKFQVRPSVGSPIILLDFRTGGSPQSAAAVVIYNATNKLITVQGPTSLLIGVPAGTYVFDFGFTLPGADFERVDGGTVTFQTGTTLAGVPGSPSAPAGSDDTVTYGGGSIPTPVPATIISALSAAHRRRRRRPPQRPRRRPQRRRRPLRPPRSVPRPQRRRRSLAPRTRARRLLQLSGCFSRLKISPSPRRIQSPI